MLKNIWVGEFCCLVEFTVTRAQTSHAATLERLQSKNGQHKGEGRTREFCCLLREENRSKNCSPHDVWEGSSCSASPGVSTHRYCLPSYRKAFFGSNAVLDGARKNRMLVFPPCTHHSSLPNSGSPFCFCNCSRFESHSLTDWGSELGSATGGRGTYLGPQQTRHLYKHCPHWEEPSSSPTVWQPSPPPFWIPLPSLWEAARLPSPWIGSRHASSQALQMTTAKAEPAGCSPGPSLMHEHQGTAASARCHHTQQQYKTQTRSFPHWNCPMCCKPTPNSNVTLSADL